MYKIILLKFATIWLLVFDFRLKLLADMLPTRMRVCVSDG